MVFGLIYGIGILIILSLLGYSIIESYNKDKMILEIRELSKSGFEKETIRDLIEDKYNTILDNDILNKYM